MTRLVSQEESRLLRKSQKLWDQLLQTEERAKEIMRETERLRRAKDEAKLKVVRKHPHLFQPLQVQDDLDDDLRSLSSDGHSHDSYLNEDLREIKDMLTRPNEGADAAAAGVERQIERLRREAASGASDPMVAAPAPATSAWPADCVPVPVETFKRLLADAAATADAASALKARRSHKGDLDQRSSRRNRKSVNGRGRNSFREESRQRCEGGVVVEDDDASHVNLGMALKLQRGIPGMPPVVRTLTVAADWSPGSFYQLLPIVEKLMSLDVNFQTILATTLPTSAARRPKLMRGKSSRRS